ncbi:MAG: phosphate-binding protein [Actinomycetia bacterium]|nr:phosphate-binding protein [Actinomycetes bacterium]
MYTKPLLRMAALLATITLAVASCSGDDGSESATGDHGAGGRGSLSGEIVISGSSTVEPISVVVAEAYRSIQPDVNIFVSGPGTGDGFKAFCAGETDISDASRPIKESEAEECAANGIDYVELKVAVDGIAVVTSADNSDVECLAFGDLYALVGPESTGIDNWSDLNNLAAEAGGNAGFADAELVISAPGTESGTYDSFVEIMVEDIADKRGQEPTIRPDYSSAADDNVIIETINTNPTSFGWVGFAFATEAANVKLVPIAEEAGGECIPATPDTIASSQYPIARDLFIYVNQAKAANSQALVDFVDHYLGFGLDEASSRAGYVGLTDEAKNETRSAWSNR